MRSRSRHARLRRCLIIVSAVSVIPLALSGCVSAILAKKIVTAPNRSGLHAMGSDSPLLQLAPGAYQETWRLPVASPSAELAVAVISPGDYAFRYDSAVTREAGKRPHLNIHAGWRTHEEIAYSTEPSRGTIVLLHGYLERKEYMVPWALALAEAGYRCVLIDQRGHGASSGDYISFGAFESRDVSALLDALAGRGWDVSRVGVLGVSYGASVGLLAAGRDARIATVVAFEPFSSAAIAVPELTRAVFTQAVAGISDAQFAAAHRRQAQIAGFDWKDADIPAALRRTQARVFFLHGAADTWLSPRHSETLYPHASVGSRLLIVPDEDHVTLRAQIEPFKRDVLEWFARELAEPVAPPATVDSGRTTAPHIVARNEERPSK